MPREPDPLVMELLRRIDSNLDHLASDLSELKACADRCISRLAAISIGLGRVETGLGRIERRLGLIDHGLGSSPGGL
jgi:hypothetical protein